MSNEPFLGGYLVYLCEIFVPGIGLGELLGVWGGEKNRLTTRLAYAFGLGIAVDTVVLVVRTSGFSVAGYTLKGIDPATIYFIIIVGVVAFGISVLRRRKVLLPIRPTLQDFALFAVMAALAVMVTLFVQKYPIFPEYNSPDFGNHVQTAQLLVSGALTSIPGGILYYGVHFQLASALLLVGGDPLVTVQRTMSILVVLSPLLVYLAASRVFSSAGAGLVAAAVYAFSGTVWFVSVFNVGLYANFFGILASLFLLVAVVDISGNIRSLPGWLVFVLAVAAAYFSHYTTITLLPALLGVPLIQLIRNRADLKRFLIPPIVAIAPAALVVVASPALVSHVLSLAVAGGGSLTGSTTLSSALASIPVLGNLALEVYSDVAFIFLLVFSAVYVYRGLVGKNAFMFIPLFWFIALLVASPQNLSSWRFSFEATAPLVLMASFGIFSLLPRLKIQKKRRGESTATQRYAKVLVVLLVLLSPIVIGSWGTTMLSDSFTDTQAVSNSQSAVYSALQWIGSNTTSNSIYLSVTDWRFTYTGLFFGRVTDYSYFASQTQAIAYAQQIGADYIIVTNLVTLSLPPVPQYFPWNTYQPSANMTLVYSNSDVRIFQLS
jgi:hypothetical protein